MTLPNYPLEFDKWLPASSGLLQGLGGVLPDFANVSSGTFTNTSSASWAHDTGGATVVWVSSSYPAGGGPTTPPTVTANGTPLTPIVPCVQVPFLPSTGIINTALNYLCGFGGIIQKVGSQIFQFLSSAVATGITFLTTTYQNVVAFGQALWNVGQNEVNMAFNYAGQVGNWIAQAFTNPMSLITNYSAIERGTVQYAENAWSSLVAGDTAAGGTLFQSEFTAIGSAVSSWAGAGVELVSGLAGDVGL